MKQPWRLSPSALFSPVLQASWPCFRPVSRSPRQRVFVDGTSSPPLSPWTLSPATWKVVQVGNLASSCESKLCHNIESWPLRTPTS